MEMYQALYNEYHVTKYSEKIDLPLGLFMHIQAQAVLLMDINLPKLIDGSSFLLKVWEYCSLLYQNARFREFETFQRN